MVANKSNNRVSEHVEKGVINNDCERSQPVVDAAKLHVRHVVLTDLVVFSLDLLLCFVLLNLTKQTCRQLVQTIHSVVLECC